MNFLKSIRSNNAYSDESDQNQLVMFILILSFVLISVILLKQFN